MTHDDCRQKLDELNREMDLMLYAISHDLRAPLRAIDGFSQAVVEDYGELLDDTGRDFLDRVRSGGRKINDYIDSLLYMSRESRGDITPEPVDMTALARQVSEAVAQNYDHAPQITIADGLTMTMDRAMARTILTKLIDNAWKFTAPVDSPRMEIGISDINGKPTCFVRDNGVGFDMAYARDGLFGPFQRMHGEDEFPGHGTGLATVKRIISRHGGEVRAESAPGQGTTLFFRVEDL